MTRSLLPVSHSSYKPRPHPRPHPPPTPPPNPLPLPSLTPSLTPSPSPHPLGPLSLLHSWLLSSTRVLVVSRGGIGEGGGVVARSVGVVRAFDRHWNLLMADVEEEVRVSGGVRRVRERQRRKVVGDVGGLEGGEGEGRRGRGRRWEWVDVDREVWVWQPRHTPQMLLRGDAVITISRYQPPPTPIDRAPAAADGAGT